MKNFTRFASYFADYIDAGYYGLTEDIQVSGELFKKAIFNGILESHLFEISDDVKRLLSLTKTPRLNDIVKLPFKTLFLDVNFKKEEMAKLGIDIGYDEIIGILVSEGYVIARDNTTNVQKIYSAEHLGSNLRITICSINKNDDARLLFDSFSENVNLKPEYGNQQLKVVKCDKTNPHARRFIHLFVLSFLNFLNDPDVSFVTVERDEKRNARRLEKAKFPIPERKIVQLTGKLKIYIDELKKNPVWHYHFRFWVRGHFRTLRNPRYGANVGRRVWIYPFIKGKGLMVEKTYQLGKLEGDIDEEGV